jgi:flagellar hook-associated protein 3 FlgL
MRVSTPYQYGSYAGDIARAQERFVALQRQVATGKKLNSLSDDPLALAASLSMKGLRDGLEQYKANLNTAKSELGLAESALSEVNTLMRRAYELAVSGANGSTDQSARLAMLSELNEIQKRLVDLGNTTDGSGEYLFSGQMTDTKPFTMSGQTLVYNGDDLDRAIEAAPGETLVASVQCRQLFTEAHAAIDSLKNNLQGNHAAISGVDIPALQASMTNVNVMRGQIGARLQAVDRWMSDHTRRADELTHSISDVEDVDLAEAIVQYQMAQAAYTGALQVASQGFGLSLLDFIRA